MRRREFIALLSGAAAVWPLATRAQQVERMRRIGVLMAITENEEGRARIAAFRDELHRLGRVEGRNIQVEIRWAAGEGETSGFCQGASEPETRCHPRQYHAGRAGASAAHERDPYSVRVRGRPCRR